MSKTTKPCPACGQVSRSRPADKACDECLRKIAAWDKHVADAHRDEEFTTVRLKGAPHWYPGFYFDGNLHLDGFSETRDELSRLFWRLAELSCVDKFDWKDRPRVEGDNDFPYVYEKPKIPYDDHRKGIGDFPLSDGSYDYNGVYGKMPKEVADILRGLWERTARFAELSYLGGIQEGRDLLTQLGSGALSSDALNRADVAIAKRIQTAAYWHKKRKKVKANP